MPRDKIVEALRRLEPGTPLERLRAASRRLAGPAVREALRAGWRAARRRPELVLAAVLVTGVAVMVLHWS